MTHAYAAQSPSAPESTMSLYYSDYSALRSALRLGLYALMVVVVGCDDTSRADQDDEAMAGGGVGYSAGARAGAEFEARAGARDSLPESAPITPYDPLPLVDPMIATGGNGAEIASVTPGASAPLGLTLIGPDTRRGAMVPPYHCAGYHYPDTHIQTFSHTHAHGVGVVEYGGIPIMPRAEWRPEYLTFRGRQAPFTHEAEEASPGRYAVTLQDDQTEVEIIATPHGAQHRYLFAEGSSPVVIFDLGDNHR